MSDRKFLTGAELTVQAAFDAGAEMMFGYPITPATEIFTGWIKSGGKYLQTEDEIAAGFGVCGAVLAGQKAFTATAGPGHTLMQDALSMAEGMRLPFVMVVGQRGGPSSGTVIYSQQEVTLACFGGNGEGHRLVYSPATIGELYALTRRAFNESWQYRFPAIVLTDGYLLKTKGVISRNKEKIENIPAHSLVKEGEIKHWRNIYTFEEELHAVLQEYQKDFLLITEDIASAEVIEADEAEILIIAHGIVAAAAGEAVKELRAMNKKASLFRPITLRPFPKKQLDAIAGKVKKIVVVESSLGQLARLVRSELAPEIDTPFEYLQYPALGVETSEIIEKILCK
jgi:2-oxoglutarate ferredoxin oxidoreductase subunit alpha